MRQYFDQIHVGMFERIHPGTLLVGNVFRDDVAKLLDQGELAVFRIALAAIQGVTPRRSEGVLQERNGPRLTRIPWGERGAQCILMPHQKPNMTILTPRRSTTTWA